MQENTGRPDLGEQIIVLVLDREGVAVRARPIAPTSACLSVASRSLPPSSLLHLSNWSWTASFSSIQPLLSESSAARSGKTVAALRAEEFATVVDLAIAVTVKSESRCRPSQS